MQVQFGKICRFIVLTSLIVGVALSYGAVRAAPPDDPLVQIGCTITLTFDTETSEQQYTVIIYNDGNIIYQETRFVGSSGVTTTFTFTITGDLGLTVPGISIELYIGEELIFATGDKGFDPTQCEGESSDCGITEGTYQGRLLATKQLFWAPNEGSSVTPYTAIPGGKAVNIISASTGWYKIQWACGIYYITSKDVAVNYDAIAKPYLASSGIN